MVFREGARPDAVAVRDLARAGDFTVTHGAAGDELELLINGLAFDLTGLGDIPAAAPAARHRFGLEDTSLGAVEAIALSASPHLAQGEAMMPVVRSQLALALRLAKLPGVVAVAWTPAHSWMATDYFERIVTAWLAGGAFPALGLTAFAGALDGGLHSEGLAFFTGQELRIEPDLVEDRAAATTLAVQLMNQLVTQEAIDTRYEFAGPEGSPLVLEPSSNGTFVRVRAAG